MTQLVDLSPYMQIAYNLMKESVNVPVTNAIDYMKYMYLFNMTSRLSIKQRYDALF